MRLIHVGLMLLIATFAMLNACSRPAGGGGIHHIPPSHASSREHTPLLMKLSVWGPDPSAIAKTWRNVEVHYRLIGDSAWIDLPMQVGALNGTEVLATADIPEFGNSQAKGFEYYFTFTFGSVSQSRGALTTPTATGDTELVPIQVPFLTEQHEVQQ